MSRQTTNTRNGEVIFAPFDGSLVDQISGDSLTLTAGTSSFVTGPFTNTQALRLDAGVAKARFTGLLPQVFYRRGTVIMWGKPRNFTGNTMLWHGTPGFTSTNMIRALIDNTNKRVDGIFLDAQGNDRSAFTANNQLTVNTWHFICMRWAIGNTVNLRINDYEKVGGVASIARKINNDLWVGSRNDSSAVAWDIGGFIAFNRRISDAEASAYRALDHYPILGEKLAPITRVPRA